MTFIPQPVQSFPPDAETAMDAILARMRSAKRAQCVGHMRPDGDCIGSLLAMGEMLAHFGVEPALAAESHIYPGYRLVPGYDRIELSPRKDFDAPLTIFLDCGDRKRAFADWPAPGFVINIDHHASNPNYGALNWVDPKCAATAEMLFHLACRGRIPLTKLAADALLLGLMTDTGCFRYSSVRPEHFEIAAQLVRAGADVTLVSKAAYECRPPGAVALEAAVMGSVQYLNGGELAWGEARRALIARHGGPQSLPENLVSEIRSIDGVRVSLLLIEPQGAGIRCSFRGDGSVNVSALAQEFGGGGHPNAAGLTINEGDYEDLRGRILARAEAVLAERAESAH